MPDNSNVSSYNKDAICVFFDTDFCVRLDLKMFDQLGGLLEELLLLFVASEHGVGKYLRDLDDYLVILKIWQPTDLLQM